jgi:hypothetical protein
MALAERIFRVQLSKPLFVAGKNDFDLAYLLTKRPSVLGYRYPMTVYPPWEERAWQGNWNSR